MKIREIQVDRPDGFMVHLEVYSSVHVTEEEIREMQVSEVWAGRSKPTKKKAAELVALGAPINHPADRGKPGAHSEYNRKVVYHESLSKSVPKIVKA